MTLADLQGEAIALANRLTAHAEDDTLSRVQRECVMSAATIIDIASARLHEAVVHGRGPLRQAPSTTVNNINDIATAIRRDAEES